MLQHLKSRIFAALAALALAAMLPVVPATAQDKQPIKIGFGMAETGPLGPAVGDGNLG
jgi:ABC-type sugar transport system substrate-binding protein